MPPTSLEASPFGTPIGAIGLPQVPKLIRTLTYFFYYKIVSVLKNIWMTFISFLYNIVYYTGMKTGLPVAAYYILS